jgi:diguanylate cyclase
MVLDVQTLLVLLIANLFAVAVALPAIMGWRVSPAARCIQGSAVAQALGWASFVAAGRWHDRLFSSLCMALLSASFVLMWHALRSWLGPRPGRGLLWTVAVATPLGYALTFDHYALRVGWSNFGLAVQMLLVCLALAWPAPGASRRWRGLVLICLAAMAGVTVWRGVLGAFFTADYPYYRAPHPVNLAAAVLNCVTLLLTTLGYLVAWREEAERELALQASTDGLTGLLNRRSFEQRADEFLSAARRYHEPLALMLIDLDHFKRLNDARGHAAGDRALQLFAGVLAGCIRRGDLACRFGGEEFCVLLRRADAAAATVFDARLRAEVAQRNGAGPALTFSTGLAVVADTDADLASVLRRADAALYQAKHEGRARLVSAL